MLNRHWSWILMCYITQICLHNASNCTDFMLTFPRGIPSNPLEISSFFSLAIPASELYDVWLWPLELTCWRQFAAQWGDCKKSRIAPPKSRIAPLNAIIIIIIIIIITATVIIIIIIIIITAIIIIIIIIIIITMWLWPVCRMYVTSPPWWKKWRRNDWREKNGWRSDPVVLRVGTISSVCIALTALCALK